MNTNNAQNKIETQNKIDKNIQEHTVLKLEIPNDTTAAAIEEGRRIAGDKSVKGYNSIDALKDALGL